VTCLVVRELLPELAIGVLSPADRGEVERHLRWCAGCRKEAAELGQAAATFAFALAPTTVPQGLRERIVERVRKAAGVPGTRRRARTAAASIVAAMVAVASLGWGAVMAGRADRFERRAQVAERDRSAAIADFERAVADLRRTVGGVLPLPQDLASDETFLGRLVPAGDEQGGGAVLQLVSPSILDFTIVIVNGLDPAAADRLPYRVRLFDAAGHVLKAGRIEELDLDGGAEVFHEFADADLTGFTSVQVVDRNGLVVLAGEVER
jgi:hypothetical protein